MRGSYEITRYNDSTVSARQVFFVSYGTNKNKLVSVSVWKIQIQRTLKVSDSYQSRSISKLRLVHHQFHEKNLLIICHAYTQITGEPHQDDNSKILKLQLIEITRLVRGPFRMFDQLSRHQLIYSGVCSLVVYAIPNERKAHRSRKLRCKNHRTIYTNKKSFYLYNWKWISRQKDRGWETKS